MEGKVWIREKYEEYRQYVEQNPRQVKRIEEFARMGTMMVPISRLGAHSEVINEGLYSILGNISSIHDHFINVKQNLLSNKENNNKTSSLIKLRMFLTFISHTEVVTEMYLRQFVNNKVCRKYIWLLEWFKVISKLFILFLMRKKAKNFMLFGNGQYNSSKQPQITNNVEEESSTAIANPTNIEPVTTLSEITVPETKKESVWIGKRTGKKLILPENLKHLSNEDSLGEVEVKDLDLSKALKTNEDKCDRTLSLIAELLNILRPLVTLYSNSWFGWVVSLLVDCLSFRLISLAHCSVGKNMKDKSVKEIMIQKLKGKDVVFKLTKLGKDEKGEVTRRSMLLMLYLMRTPFYDKYTLSWARTLQDSLKKLPFLNQLGNFVEDTLNYYHKVHFYNSGS